MKEYRIAIVDDDKDAQLRLKEFFNKYSEENDCKFVISFYEDGDEITDEYKCQFDILFLDIEMKRVSGMKAAEIIRDIDKEVQIIFVTNSTQYAVEGYRVGALSYLLKPASYFMFCKELKRCIDELDRNESKYLVIATQSGVNKLVLDDIIYIESFRHKVIYHTTSDAEIEAYGTMKDLEKSLSGDDFFRCNSGYLVNMKHVEGIKDEDALLTGKRVLKISRSRKKEFMEALLAFYARR